MRTSCLLLMMLSVALLTGCRGADDADIVEPQFPLTDDPDAFAAFLNTAPGVPREGVPAGEIDNVADFPEAYYNTIDPDDTRDTFFKWRLANGFINADGSEADCDPNSCIETHVTFRDTKDLGYGRNMFMRRNTVSGDVAIYVENFQVDAVPGIPYGPLNFEALVNNDRQWNFGVNAIEFSAFPATAADADKFTKFYNFAGDGIRASGTSGSLQHFVDLDNRGMKAMPGACIVCHGGRGRTLVVRDGEGEKTLAPTLVGAVPGDLQAQLQTIEFDTLQFANEAGFTREDNEDGIRLINEAVLASYEYRANRFTGDGDWDAQLAIDTLKGRYAGNPSDSANRYDADFIPGGWSANQNLYLSLMGPNCLVCHALRGTVATSSVAFPTLAGFDSYAARIDHLIYEQGKMPLGLLNYSNFWDSSDKDPATMATALGLSSRIDANQMAVAPGSPVAVISAPPLATGVSVAGAALDIAITGSGSAFARADGHRWQVSPSDTASIVPSGVQGDAVLRTQTVGTYTLTLTVEGLDGSSDTSSQTVRVLGADDAEAPLPGEQISYFGENGINELAVEKCQSCHSPEGGLDSLPIHYSACQSNDFNGNEFLYRSVLARVNFDSPLDSLFLRKPVNGATDPLDLVGSTIPGYHAGGALLTEAQYSTVMSWILNGAPAGVLPAVSTISADALSCNP